MAGGAVVAAAVAARRRRLTEVIEAFRAAGATTPEGARPLNDALTGYAREIDELAGDGILVESNGRWYLDEVAFAAWQEAHWRGRPMRVLTAVSVGLAIAALLVVLGLWIASRRF